MLCLLFVIPISHHGAQQILFFFPHNTVKDLEIRFLLNSSVKARMNR